MIADWKKNVEQFYLNTPLVFTRDVAKNEVVLIQVLCVVRSIITHGLNGLFSASDRCVECHQHVLTNTCRCYVHVGYRKAPGKRDVPVVTHPLTCGKEARIKEFTDFFFFYWLIGFNIQMPKNKKTNPLHLNQWVQWSSFNWRGDWHSCGLALQISGKLFIYLFISSVLRRTHEYFIYNAASIIMGGNRGKLTTIRRMVK